MTPYPDDFPVEARKMNISAAAKKYKRDTRTIKKWALIAGDGLMEAMIENAKFSNKLGGKLAGRKFGKVNMAFTVPELDKLTPEQEAMRYLQRKTRWVCYSSRIMGDSKNVYYVVGTRKLTREQLLQVAAQHGFEG